MSTGWSNNSVFQMEATKQARELVAFIEAGRGDNLNACMESPLYYASLAITYANIGRAESDCFGPDEVVRLLASGPEYSLPFIRREVPLQFQYPVITFFENLWSRSRDFVQLNFLPVA